MPESKVRFITAGIQHLCFWKLAGNNLEYQVGELTIPKAFSMRGKGAHSHIPKNKGKYGLSIVSKDGQTDNQDDF